jgi:hypothetical protein
VTLASSVDGIRLLYMNFSSVFRVKEAPELSETMVPLTNVIFPSLQNWRFDTKGSENLKSHKIFTVKSDITVTMLQENIKK